MDSWLETDLTAVVGFAVVEKNLQTAVAAVGALLQRTSSVCLPVLQTAAVAVA